MKRVIIDTDILINFLRGRDKAKDFLLSIVEEADLFCSVITVAEIFAGMKENEREKTVELIDSLEVVEITRDIAEKAGNYKRKEKGYTLELDDCLIAATAFVEKACLATGNGKHYPMTDIDKIIVKV